MSTQQNVTIEEGHEPKYEVGVPLVFTHYNPKELEVSYSDTFKSGDVLRPVEHNGCGLGIDVRRDSDGVTDMVFPEEVELG